MAFQRMAHWSRMARDPDYREWRRVVHLPPRTAGTTDVLGPTLKFVDGRSCFLQHLVIFERESYAFHPDRRDPRILDVGANIGMSVLYLKMLCPGARVDAFEADGRIAGVLRENLRSFGHHDVTVHHAAAWDREGQMTFLQEGTEGGRLDEVAGDAGGRREVVPTVRLRDFLDEPIDFLKLDVEGAEFRILQDCRDRLPAVDRLFVEYHSFLGREQMLPELLALLKGAGFRLQVHTDHCSPTPLRGAAASAGMDLRLNIFCDRPRRGAGPANGTSAG